MKPPVRLCLAVVGALFVLPMLPAEAAGMASSGSLEQVVTAKNTGASSTQTTKVYWEANRMRVETYTVLGVIVEIQNGKTLYAYNPAKKEAVKTALSDESITVQARLKAMAAPLKDTKRVDAWAKSVPKTGSSGKK